jgi:alpha-glucuronidase
MQISRRAFLTMALLGAVLASTARLSFAQGRGAPTFAPATNLAGEDGSKLWLRYAPVPNSTFKGQITSFLVEGDSPTLAIIKKEFADGISGMLGTSPTAWDRTSAGAVVIGTPASSPAIKQLNLDTDLQKVGNEGYIIRSVSRAGGKPTIIIAANTDLGALYGTFHLLRLIATGEPYAANFNIAETPAMKIRMADHWDNSVGTIERGYAGRSIVFAADPVTGTPAWDSPDWKPSPRWAEYARAAASLGMNGVCINNVNATAAMLSSASIKKVALLADICRPYGLRVYMSANFSAPVTLDHMQTADPNDPTVQKWWKDKADEIYKAIPNFGGMLVKANSEGQPGPKDYNRTHAEGANCLAAGFAPHDGIVIWRAFVYDAHVDEDRIKRAYKEFMPLDGKFLPNVVVQIKNGPLDFMPREPFSPLFGALTKTSFMAEIQPSQEYLGQARHLVYLGTMWEEFLQSDTFAKGPGSTVSKVLQAKVQPVAMTGIAGVLNPGQDINWTGHHFSQSNWYAFGRLCWNPDLSAKTIAEEWTKMTFTHDPAALNTVVNLMMGSRETYLNYCMPLGLHHLIGGDHYAPQPQNASGQADWTAVYYHKASIDGIGYDRTRKGDGAVDQYFKPLSDTFDSLDTCPEKYLLWFHRLPWDYRTKSGKTLWEDIIAHYDLGLKDVRAMQKTWAGLKGKIDDRRHKEVADRLEVQVRDALAWRNSCLGYFAGINKLPLPPAPAE